MSIPLSPSSSLLFEAGVSHLSSMLSGELSHSKPCHWEHVEHKDEKVHELKLPGPEKLSFMSEQALPSF
jgi:hypothetical protein